MRDLCSNCACPCPFPGCGWTCILVVKSQNVITPPPCQWNKRGFISWNKKTLVATGTTVLGNSPDAWGWLAHRAVCSISVPSGQSRKEAPRSRSSSLLHTANQTNSEVTMQLQPVTTWVCVHVCVCIVENGPQSLGCSRQTFYL